MSLNDSKWNRKSTCFKVLNTSESTDLNLYRHLYVKYVLFTFVKVIIFPCSAVKSAAISVCCQMFKFEYSIEREFSPLLANNSSGFQALTAVCSCY